MKRLFFALATAAVVTFGLGGVASAGTCFICKSSDSKDKCSGAQYCKSESGSDTSEDRKKCQKAGCAIGGTGSCPTAANVKVCTASVATPENPYVYAAYAPYYDLNSYAY